MDLKEYEDSKGIELVWCEGFENFESRKNVFNEIIEALKDDYVTIVGTWGMAGIGKTKLAIELGKKAKDDKMFDCVLYAVVSQTPNISKIQGMLADMLDLQLNKTLEGDRATKLSMRLKNAGKVLIILDDVWEKVNLANIGIPLRLNQKGCKIVLTTRRDQVCDDMNCQRKVRLEVLSKSEALALFNKHARIDCGSWLSSRARKIVKECAGLPLAIEVVGSALRNKCSEDYDDAIWRLSRARFVDMEGVDKEIYHHIEWSFEYLQCDLTKRCFLLCSLYPEDADIKLEDFTRLAFGLSLFENVNSVEEARKSMLKCITDLVDACLLLPFSNMWRGTVCKTWSESVVNGGFSYSPSVKMHDVVRDVALWLAKKSEKNYVPTSSVLKQRRMTYENADAISIKHYHLDCPLPDRLNCPKLKVLLLELNSSTRLRYDFFKMMTCLQVLDLQNWNGELPISIQHLHNLRVFHLHGSYWSPRNTINYAIIGKLKNLQILSLHSSHIEELPEEIGELTSLKLLDLTCCTKLRKIHRNSMSSLTALEEFYTYSASKSNVFQVDDDLLTELTSSPHLTVFTAMVNCMRGLPPLRFRKPLLRYTILFSKVVNNYFDGLRNMSIDVLDCSHMELLQQLIPQVENLIIGCLNNALQDLLPMVDEECFENLSRLEVQVCHLECLIDTTRTCQLMPTLSNLSSLTLMGMTRMARLCKGPPPPGWLTNLNIVVIKDCRIFQNVVPHVIPLEAMLVELSVENCRLQHIFEFDMQDLQRIKTEMSLFSCPLDMSFTHLPELIRIWNVPDILETLELTSHENQDEFYNLIAEAMQRCLNSIATISLAHCEKMEEVFRLVDYNGGKYEEQMSNLVDLFLSNLCQLRCIWKGPHQNLNLQGLERITIENCNKLSSIFSPACAKSLTNLRYLKINNCGALEAIISFPEDEIPACSDSSLTVVNIPKLESISISSCDELKSVLPLSVIAQGLPKLESIYIFGCEKLEQIFGNRGETMTKGEVIALNSLQSLELELLPSLVCFSTVDDHLICPSLKNLKVKQVGMSYRHDLLRIKEKNLDNHVFEQDLVQYCREIVPKAMLHSLDSLKSVQLLDFHGREDLFDFSDMITGEQQQPLGSLLESLTLRSLVALTHIWMGPIRSVELHYLVLLHVQDCPNLRTLFTSAIAGPLKNLETIEIENCPILEIIFAMSEAHCVNESGFQEYVCLPKLKRINIKECHKLKIVFSLSKDQELSLLEYIEIHSCPILEHVFDVYQGKQRENGNLSEMKLPKLKILKIINVPRSMVFTSSSHPLICPCLSYFFLEGMDSSDITIVSRRFADIGLMEPQRNLKMPNCYESGGTIQPRAPQSCMALDKAVIRNWNVQELFDLTQIVERSSQLPVLDNFRKLILRDLPDLKCIWKGPTCFVKRINLCHIEVHNCGALKKSLFTHSIAQSLCSLVNLVVRNCKELEYIVEPRDDNLKVEEEGISSSVSYLSSLIKIEVEGCESLKFIFPLSVAQRLPLLKEMMIKRAPLLEQVIGDDQRKWFAENEEIMLPELRILKLEDLPSLHRIFPQGYGLSRSSVAQLQQLFIQNCNIEHGFDLRTNDGYMILNLEDLYLADLPNLEYMCKGSTNPCHLRKICIHNCRMLEYIFEDQSDEQGSSSSASSASTGFLKLSNVEVEGCDNLKTIFPLSISQKLPSLKKMSIKAACQLVQIFSDNQIKRRAQGKEIMLPKLRILELEHLPSLTHIFPPGYVLSSLSFSALHVVFIKNCNIEGVFDCTSLNLMGSDSYPGPVFTNLAVLYLCCLPNLTYIWKVPHPCSFMGFNELKSVYVRGCERLKTVFPEDQFFPTLETVQVEGVCNLWEVFRLPCPLWSIWLRVPQLKIVKLGHLPCGAFSSEEFAFASYVKLVDLEDQVHVDLPAALKAYTDIKMRESAESNCPCH